VPVPDVYLVRRGDTLWDISGRFFGNPWEWPRLWSLNPAITNPHWIYPDQSLNLQGGGSATTLVPGGHVEIAPSDAPSEAHRGADGPIRLRDQGFLDPEALSAAGEIVGSPEDHMMLSSYDEVYVRFEDESSVRPGMELTVFRRIGAAERAPDEKGELVRILGTVRMRTYDPDTNVGRGIITEALDPIERGFSVADVPRQIQHVPARRNEAEVEALVVATLRANQLLSEQQLIFVDKGADDGVQVGNRFFLIHEGDQWRRALTVSEEASGATTEASEQPTEYPPEVVAEGRVVTVRPKSAGLLVTRSVSEVGIGDRAQMRAGY